MKKALIILLLFIYGKGACQIAVGYFPLNNTYIQVSANPERLVLGDVKLQTNTFSYNTTVELAPYINVKRTETVNLYLGPGISISPFYNDGTNQVNYYFLCFGARVKPLPHNRHIAILLELSPIFTSVPRNNMLRSNLGVSYHFRKRVNTVKKAL